MDSQRALCVYNYQLLSPSSERQSLIMYNPSLGIVTMAYAIRMHENSSATLPPFNNLPSSLTRYMRAPKIRAHVFTCLHSNAKPAHKTSPSSTVDQGEVDKTIDCTPVCSRRHTQSIAGVVNERSAFTSLAGMYPKPGGQIHQ